MNTLTRRGTDKERWMIVERREAVYKKCLRVSEIRLNVKVSYMRRNVHFY